MLNDLYEILKESLKKLLASRTFILGVFFVFLFGILAVQIFRLQIIEGEEYQENYMTKTKKTIMLAGTRGNIYDRNGNLLAYNQLAYNVTIQDNGDYTTTAERNRMLLLLVQILNRHGEKVRGEFAVAIEPSGEMGLHHLQRDGQKAVHQRLLRLKIPLGAGCRGREHALGYHSQGDVRRQI